MGGQRIKYTAKSNGQEYAGSVVAKRGNGYVLNLDVGKVKEVDSSDVWRIVSEGASVAMASTACQPSVVAAPAASYVAPAPAVLPAVSLPAVTLGAPAVSIAAPPPTVVAAPAASYVAPSASFAPVSYAAPPAAPRLESLAPASSYAAPVVEYAAPATSFAVTGSPYGAPMPLAVPVQYGQPGTVVEQAYASPVYTHPYPIAY